MFKLDSRLKGETKLSCDSAFASLRPFTGAQSLSSEEAKHLR